MSYRAAISLEGCSGFEWNILECSDDEVEQLRAFVSLYKELRGVLHHGTVMHADFKDPALRGRGVVSDDGKRAVWVVATVTNLRDVLTERLRMPGLDPDCMYRVRLRDEVGEVRWGWNTPAMDFRGADGQLQGLRPPAERNRPAGAAAVAA